MTRGNDDDIAIVGYGGVFPGASDPEQFWSNVEGLVDATSEPPPGRWLLDPCLAYDPRIPRPDRVYSTRGGFCAEPRLDPDDLKSLDPVFRLTLQVASAAWNSARMRDVDRGRVGLIYGHIVLPTEGSSSFSRSVLCRPIEQALGLREGPSESTDPRDVFPAGLPAALTARALGLGGPVFTLDAACASTLYALKLAVDLLRSGRVDAMLSGGVSRPDPLYTQMGFSQLQALSARGKPAPFDEHGDGLVVGEGAGLFVLKRLGDALRQGDTIHGVIRGIGLSNDLSGDLLAPSSEGQLRAMRSAYEQAGWQPTDVDLIECHATGTPVGDAVEVESLKQLWGDRDSGWSPGQCVLGSVKSNVGHMLTAAGAAGLLKVLKAFEHGVKPATIHFSRPAPRLGLEGSPFRIARATEPWPARSPGRARRAALSGFGFGGINAHLLLEEWIGDAAPGKAATGSPPNLPPDDGGTNGGSGGDSLATGQGFSPPLPPLRKGRSSEHVQTSVAPSLEHAVAIVGMAAHFGGCGDRDAFREQVLGFESSDVPGSRELEPFGIPVDRFRIPPRELGEILPQQSLMLKVAADAIEDARWSPALGPRTGVLVGLGLDPNTSNYQLRWWLSAKVPEWNKALGLGLSPAEQEHWLDELLASAGPPLSANRTMGSLGGLVASRIAREFRIGGPSFSVSCDEGSGIEALRIAADWIRRGELDSAIVGAVDLVGDSRTTRALEQLGRPAAPGEGAIALVLKRHDDAIRDGDRVYSVLPDDGADVPACSEDLPDQVTRTIGHSVAVHGLAAVAAGALRLFHRVEPTEADGNAPRFWLRNRQDGPRRLDVSLTTLGGTRHGLRLAEADAVEDVSEVVTPQRPVAVFVVEGDDRAGLAVRAEELIALASGAGSEPVDHLARRWWGRHPGEPRRKLGMVVLAECCEHLRQGAEAIRRVASGQDAGFSSPGLSVIAPGPDLGSEARLAFVYPGLGNVFPGMGRSLALHFPDVLRRQDARNGRLREQFVPEVFWNGDGLPRFDDHRPPILGQVAVGCLVTDVLRLAGVRPDAAIGYSMGESAALVALGAWNDRDEMAGRLLASPLFATALAGPCAAARRAWELTDAEPVDWLAGIVPTSAARVRAAIGERLRVHVLIVNSDEETVIGGQAAAVRAVVRELGVPILELPTVSTVHCPVGLTVEEEYRALHDLPTSTPEGIDFYSGVWKRAYRPDRRLAAEAITAQAAGTIDFPAVVEQAYADGVRVFVEAGPGGSCTRLIGRILGERPHLAVAACLPNRDEFANLLEVLGRLVACRVPVDLGDIYGRDAAVSHPRDSSVDERRTVRIEPRQMPIVREVPIPARPIVEAKFASEVVPMATSRPESPPAFPLPAPSPETRELALSASHSSPLLRQALQTETARAEAHSAFLKVSQDLGGLIARNLEIQLELLGRGGSVVALNTGPGAPRFSDAPLDSPGEPPPFMDRGQCLEFAVGSIAAVLGAEFAAIDAYPTRVRLPDEPLMLVDRVVSVEGEPRSMSSGRVVTEHDIHEGAWYLDAGRIPPCIAIESGQADLFLSGYLGIDFITRGLAVYRLLDATVTFHRGLPRPGAVIRYDIRITRFFRQGETHLFRFEFDGTVDGEPLLTMRDGCAGFFSAEELAAGQGVVPRPLDARPRPGVKPDDWRDLVPLASCQLDEHQVEALRRGALAEAFGAPFDRLDLPNPLPLPGGRMTLVHRVETLDPRGGRFGLGLIRAEADIHPGDWFMVCHFVDDRVMPGTLMYECCLHTLRIFLTRLGWVGDADRVAFEPLPGVANRLRCRGQVVESTRIVTYEVVVKELGYGPEPYAIADAIMYADGKPIVEITDMAMRLAGTDRAELERLWEGVPDHAPAPAVYGREQILAFATGRPSEGFGDRYRPFDADRFIARLPAPPYSYLDRVTVLAGNPWDMAAGTAAETEYDVPEDAWYFEADRQDQVPYAVLLEVALQACGWTSAFMGSALHSDGPLKFRNLGGTATQHARVDRRSGTLRTRVTATKVTRSAGMIIQHYDFSVRSDAGPVFDGQTYFGFFHPDALAEQVGIREAVPYTLTPEEAARARSFPLPDRDPLPDGRWRMVERVDALVLDGGPHGLGVIEGSTRVDPAAWFFKAHFLGDPVWPGSLGLESLLQLLKVVAVERWGGAGQVCFDSPGTGDEHRWVYRGQIVPANGRVTVQAVITAIDDDRRRIRADGHLSVDGKIIYQMNEFTLRLHPSG